MIETLSPETFADALRPAVADYYDRHMNSLRPWAAYQEIDWSQGESYKNQPWAPDHYPLDDGVRSAIHVNLLTEDNAPWYTNLLMSRTPADHPLIDWNGRWTMEEGQHSYAIRAWATISRAVDPALLEAGRIVQMSNGQVPQPATMADMLAYVPFQEKATQVAHRNTASHLAKEDKVGRRVMALIAGDEGRHYAFYKDVAATALQIDPSQMMIAIAGQVIDFDMPGTGIPDFNDYAKKIAKADIYNLRHYKEEVVEPTINEWGIENLEGLDDEAKLARDQMYEKLAKIGRVAARLFPAPN